jgi:hypothetical protein
MLGICRWSTVQAFRNIRALERALIRYVRYVAASLAVENPWAVFYIPPLAVVFPNLPCVFCQVHAIVPPASVRASAADGRCSGRCR